jgi:hypothetical protein
MNKTSLVYGLITGLVILVSFFALSAFMGAPEELTPEKYRQAEAVGQVRYLILLVGIVLAMLSFRKQSAGSVTYRSAIGIGIQAALVIAVIVALMEGAFMAMNPEFGEAAKDVYLQEMRDSGASADKIAAETEKMDSMAWMMTPAGTGAFYLFETAVAGTLVALIAGIFVKRKG